MASVGIAKSWIQHGSEAASIDVLKKFGGKLFVVERFGNFDSKKGLLLPADCVFLNWEIAGRRRLLLTPNKESLVNFYCYRENGVMLENGTAVMKKVIHAIAPIGSILLTRSETLNGERFYFNKITRLGRPTDREDIERSDAIRCIRNLNENYNAAVESYFLGNN